MRNMKAICIKLTCFLLVLSMSSAAMAEHHLAQWTTSIKLPSILKVNLFMNFSTKEKLL